MDSDGITDLIIEVLFGAAVAVTVSIIPLGVYPFYSKTLRVYQHLIDLFQNISPLPIPRIISTVGMMINICGIFVVGFPPILFVLVCGIFYGSSQAKSMRHMRNLWYGFHAQILYNA